MSSCTIIPQETIDSVTKVMGSDSPDVSGFSANPKQRRRAQLFHKLTADLSFADAADRYMRMRSVASTPGGAKARYIKPNTETAYCNNLNSAKLFFSGWRLIDIDWSDLRAYQEARLAGAEPFIRYRRPQDAKERRVGDTVLPPIGKRPCPVKPQQVNQETRLIKKLKVLSGCWTPDDQAYFEDLQEEESDVQRALEPDEQQHWINTAASSERWKMVLWWSIISFDLICSPGELRGQQIGNINFNHQMVRIPWPCAKNRFRHRDIPISSPDTLWAYERVMERAASLGARDPRHYLFPFRITRSNVSFPDRPMTDSGLKKLWQEVREGSGLTWFRMEDTRHTGATRLAESGVPAPVIMQRMGHSDLRMQQHYQQISDQAQRAWMRHANTYGNGLPPRIPPQREYNSGFGAAPWRPLRPVENFSQKKY